MRKLLILLLMCTTAVALAQEEDPQQYGIHGNEVPKGLAVGQEAPDIELKDQYGENFKLSNALREGPVVLTFYRGNWCPYCTRFLAELSTFADEIEEKGASIIAVSPESSKQLVSTGQETHENITLLSDYNGEIVDTYDVGYEVTNDYQQRLDKNKGVQIKDHNEQKVAILPVAATYVINKDGEIVYCHFDLDYKKRAPINEITEALDKL